MSCRKSEGGEPLCPLGLHAIKVEIRGQSLLNVQNCIKYSKDCSDPLLGLPISDIDLLVIGESPGKVENAFGQPFMGFAGKFMVDAIAKAGFDNTRVAFTYMVRCHVTSGAKTRKASVTEINACRGYLDDEIKFYNPKVILLLGADTLRVFNLHKEGKISEIAGRIFKCTLPSDPTGPEYNVLPTVNPNSLYYHDDPNLAKYILSHIYKAAEHVYGSNKIPEPNSIDAIIATEISHVVEYFKGVGTLTGFIAFDTELRSLRWWQDPLLSIQIAKDPYTAPLVIPWYHTCEEGDPNRIEPFNIKSCWSSADKELIKKILRRVFENPNLSKAAHNAKFDLNVLKHILGINVQGFIFDTMLMHHLLNEIPPHDLESLASIYLGYHDYSKEIRDIVGHGRVKKPYDLIPNDLLWKYGALDVQATFRLANIFYNQMTSTGDSLFNLYQDEVQPAIRAFASAEYYGSPVDMDICQEQIVEGKLKLEQLLTACRKYTTPEFNPSSPVQTVNALTALGFGKKLLRPGTAKGYSADKKVLMDLAAQHPLPEAILEYRALSKLVTAYYERLPEEVDSSNVFRATFNLHGTKTGRLSAPRLHQIPKLDDKLTKLNKNQPRHMFIAGPGHKYIYADYNQLELRVMAVVSKDKELAEAIKGDFHTLTAATFLEMEVEEFMHHPYYKFNRTEIGKRINFGLQYGSEGHSLVKLGKWMDKDGRQRPITWSMLEAGMERWWAKFHKLKQFRVDKLDEIRANNGVAISVFGRRRRFGKVLYSEDDGPRKAAEREALNFLVQSPSGAIAVRTINILHKKLLPNVGNIRLVNSVHDSIAYIVKDGSLVNLWKLTMQEVAGRPIPQLDNTKFPVNIGVGDSWAAAEINSR